MAQSIPAVGAVFRIVNYRNHADKVVITIETTDQLAADFLRFFVAAPGRSAHRVAPSRLALKASLSLPPKPALWQAAPVARGFAE